MGGASLMVAVSVATPRAAVAAVRRRRLETLLADRSLTTVVSATSRDPNAKVVVVLLDAATGVPRWAVKVPTTDAAAAAVEREATALDAIAQRLEGHPLAATLPRVVDWVDVAGRAAVVTTALAGTPLSVLYHRHGHTRTPARVTADFAAAAAWLTELQHTTASARRPVDMDAGVGERLRHRFADVAALPTLLDALKAAYHRLAEATTPATVVHGDFWYGNLLVGADGIAGVVDWEAAAVAGEPLRDVARFVLGYALYLDRHTPPGAPVRGHPGLRATGFGAGITYVVTGQGWFCDVARGFLVAALRRLGAPAPLWRDVVVAGIAEVAATADHDGFARHHLAVLADLCGGPAVEVDRWQP